MFYVVFTIQQDSHMPLKRVGDTDDAAITHGGMYHKLASRKMILTCLVLKKCFSCDNKPE